MEDKYFGQGGSYILDPKTSKRKLVRRTQPAPSNPSTEETENGEKDKT